MKKLLLIFASFFSGYIVANLKYKTFEETIDELKIKMISWYSVLKDTIGNTLLSVEGVDFDVFKANIDLFIENLKSKSSVFNNIESFDEKIKFVETEFLEFSTELLSKIKDNKDVKKKVIKGK